MFRYIIIIIYEVPTNFWLYYFMYFALSVVTGFQRDSGCGAAGSGEGVLIRRVKGCVKNIEIVFL